jgi:CRP-like cAMP-binding protein
VQKGQSNLFLGGLYELTTAALLATQAPLSFLGAKQLSVAMFIGVTELVLLLCVPFGVEMVADANPEVARALHEVALAAAARAERQILILGQMTAAEKVVAFLLSMVQRLSPDGKDEVTLPVSRYEIERAWCTPFPAKRF